MADLTAKRQNLHTEYTWAQRHTADLYAVQIDFLSAYFEPNTKRETEKSCKPLAKQIRFSV